MEKTIKMICFDMDGTIADLYAVENWLPMLRAFDPTPYEIAEPMWNMAELANLLHQAQAIGIEIRIITWLSKDTNTEYDRAVREAKRNWLTAQGFPFDHFHGVQYGATKADSIRRYLAENETAILFDDNAKVRSGWHMGEAVDPTEVNILDYLADLMAQNP
jgi:phosphoglycolate phosphatase-like HAD superfamily hydrolase